jgi:transposase-like protein
MTTETKKRRSYTEDFKRDAVALVTEQGYKALMNHEKDFNKLSGTS